MRGRYHLRQAFKYKNLGSREVELSGDSLSCKNITHRVSSLLGPDVSMGSSSVSLRCRADVERARNYRQLPGGEPSLHYVKEPPQAFDEGKDLANY